MTTDNPYAPPKAQVDDVVPTATPSDQPPPMWNPGAAAAWSLLFSPVLGAWLQMLNWRSLGEPALAEQSRRWALGGVALLGLSLVAALIWPESKILDVLGRVTGIAFLLVWYSQLGKLQVHRVKTRFGGVYPRRGWLKPLLIALGLWVAVIIVMVLLGLALGLA